MRDLEFFELPLGNITLERLDVLNNKHIKAINGLRDFSAKRLCYDVKQDISASKKGSLSGNSFLVRNDDDYFGYMFISNDYDGERVLSYIVQKKMRGRGLGRVMLTSVSDYLLDNGISNSLKLYIKPQNIASARLAISCGFNQGEKNDTYFRTK